VAEATSGSRPVQKSPDSGGAAGAAVAAGLSPLDRLDEDLAGDLGIEGDGGLADLDDVGRRALVEPHLAARDDAERGQPVHPVVELGGDEDDAPGGAQLEVAQPGHQRPQRPLEGAAAGPWRDGPAVRAGGRVAQQGADRLGRLGREDVLQLAGLGLHGRLGDRQQVLEEPLGEPVPPHHVAGSRQYVVAAPVAKTQWNSEC